MRLTDDIYASTIRYYKQYLTPSGEQTAPESTESHTDEPAVLLDLSFGMRQKEEKGTYLDKVRAEKNKNNQNNDLQDHSGRLTKRLVAAKSKEEVHSILADAYKNLGDALKAAAGGDEKALEIVKRINKLIRRANRKVRDLSKEDELRRKEKSAKKKELEQLAKQLELELKQKIEERKKRERKYLKDANEKEKPKHPPAIQSSATLNIKMQALMHRMALSTTSAPAPQPSISPESSTESAEPADE